MPKSSQKRTQRFTFLSTLLQFWNRVALPFVERSLRGRRGVTWASVGLAIAALGLLLSLQIVHSPSPDMRDWRQTFALESDDETIAWSQCGFCVAIDAETESYDIWTRDELLADLAAVDPRQAEACVRQNAAEADAYASGNSERIERMRAEQESTSICPGPSRLHGAWNAAGQYFRHDQEFHPWQRMNADTFMKRKAMITAANFMPTIETYRSPLTWTDLPRVWALLSGCFLMLLVTMVAPTAIALRVGRELHEETFAILRATQIPPTRLLAGLVAEALAPWLLVALPSLLVLTTMAIFAGNGAFVPGTLGALLLTGSIGGVFAFMLALAAGERIQAGILALITTGIGTIHCLATTGVLRDLFRYADRFELYTAWPSLWAGRNLAAIGKVWPNSIDNAWQSPSVLTLWTLAAGILAALSIAAARRLQLEAKPAATRLNWTILSAMVGGVLSFLAYCDHNYSYGGRLHSYESHFTPAWLLGAFVLTLLSFYRSPLRPRIVVPRSSSLKDKKEIWLCNQLLLGLSIMTAVLVASQYGAFYCGISSMSMSFPFPARILPSVLAVLWFVTCGSWCMLWLSGGIQGFRAHLGLGFVAFALGGHFLRLIWFSRHSAYSDFYKPSFLLFEDNIVLGFLQLATLILVPLALRRAIRARTTLPAHSSQANSSPTSSTPTNSAQPI